VGGSFTLRISRGYGAPVTKVDGASWTVEVTYACRCGVHYRATRWRWIDADARPDEVERAHREGPIRGRCPSCGAAASGQTDWVEIAAANQRCVLNLAANQRHAIVELLRDHFAAVAERVRVGELAFAEPWLLRPVWGFDGEVGIREPSSRADAVADAEADADEQEDTAKRRPPAGPPKPTDVGVPTAVGTQWPAEEDSNSSAANTHVVTPVMERSATGDDDEELVTIALDLDPVGRSLWGQAALQVRPIHLREHGYPLIGVRLVASYLGRMALIDGVIDVASEGASELFASLSRRFRVQLVLRGDDSTSVVRREVSARDLERNAALCLESARASLARSEYPREAFVAALEHLRETPIEDRLRGADQTLVAGAYRHLISPRETWVALEHLEAASDKRNLAHLLEVDGLSVDEYEAIRRRVLVASVEHGVCAPRRFWRRIIASGLVDDFDDYAGKLARSRAEADQDGDDLDHDQRGAAWARIAELCDLKQLEYPVELARKLGLEVSDRPRRRTRSDSGKRVPADDPNRSRSAAGEIQARPARTSGANMREQLSDPELRLRVATAALANGGSPEAVDAVFDVLEQFAEEELLALIPSLAELGTQAVPNLHAKLDSPAQQVRQASAILLGLTKDSSSIAPLLRSLTREPSRVWFDMARAIGGLGTSALERLCAVARQAGRGERFPIEKRELLDRIARAMAEVVSAEGREGSHGIARDTVENLARSSEPDIAYAASRALATLHDVSLAGAQIRGERALPDITQLRGFARRAFEAILVPELDLLDDELDEALDEVLEEEELDEVEAEIL
jgi:hypothetical protein